MTERRPPRCEIVIDFEARMRPRIVADSHEDELRMRGWLRAALRRRLPIGDELERWLDELDEAQAA